MGDTKFKKEIIQEDGEMKEEEIKEQAIDIKETDSQKSANQEESVAELKKRVEELEKELASSREKFLRLIAESDNLRKRLIRDNEEAKKRANEQLIKDLLPVLDNLARALEMVEHAKGLPKDFIIGIQMVEQEFLRVLAKHGLKAMEDAQDKPFDPTIHEALHTVETDEVEPGTVIRQVNRGFYLNDKLFRPAQVIVASKPENTVPGVAIDPEEFSEEEGEEASENREEEKSSEAREE